MYLKKLHIENIGPIRRLKMDMPFDQDGKPNPLIIVGQNGSGKTNLLSIITDALFQAGNVYYKDLLERSTQTEKPYFRVVGGNLTTLGSGGGFSILQFKDRDKTYLFKEKAGRLPKELAKELLDEDLHPAVQWEEDGSIKEFEIQPKQVETIFENNIFLYFPSSRHEIPNWLNESRLPDDNKEFDLSSRYRGNLGKPLYVSRSLNKFQQWLLSLIVDVRADIIVNTNDQGQMQFSLGQDVGPCLIAQQIWGLVNVILKKIMGDETVRFTWLGRFGTKLGISSPQGICLTDLSALSSGQATLLSIFGSLVRYADTSQNKVLRADQITGICIIDEIDAHMHIDLQYKALPELIKLFPKVQFIVSCHSPLFVLGADQALGSENVSIIEMPTGIQIQAEDYAEFGKAISVFQETSKYTKLVMEAVKEAGKPLVLLEGETDPKYFDAAVQALECREILNGVEFQWIGAKDPTNGQANNTGSPALDAAYRFLCTNPELVKRPVLLLYDNDVNKPSSNLENLFIRTLPRNADNTIVQNGIENLLPRSVFTDEMYNKKESKHPNGTTNITITLDKMKLCNHVCEHHANADTFAKFDAVLGMIAEVFGLNVSQEIDQPTEAEATET
ncbi:MAG: AAA family ATPase [Bdellovibrionales bacterium]